MISGLARKLRKGIGPAVTGLAALFIGSCGNVNSDDGGNDSSGNDDYVGNPYLNNNDNFGNGGNSGGGGNSGNSGGSNNGSNGGNSDGGSGCGFFCDLDDTFNDGFGDGNFGDSAILGRLIPGDYAGDMVCNYSLRNSISGEELDLGSEEYIEGIVTINNDGFPTLYKTRPYVGMKYRPFIGDLGIESYEGEIIGIDEDLLSFVDPRNIVIISSISGSVDNNGWDFVGHNIEAFIHAPYDDPISDAEEGDLLFFDYFEGRSEEFNFENGRNYDTMISECSAVFRPAWGG